MNAGLAQLKESRAILVNNHYIAIANGKIDYGKQLNAKIKEFDAAIYHLERDFTK